MNKRIVSRIGAVIVAAGMLLSGMPVHAACVPTAATQAAGAPVNALLNKTQKTQVRSVLQEYLNKTRYFSDETVYGGNSWIAAASNPQFAIADLNADGVLEMYVSGGSGSQWDCYVLNGLKTSHEGVPEYDYIMVSGYSAAAGGWSQQYDDSYYLCSVYSNTGAEWTEVMTITSEGNGTASMYIGESSALITTAQAKAFAAAFPLLDLYLAGIVQPLTPATINAFK